MIRVVSIIGLVAAVLAGVVLLPVEVPYSVSGLGVLMPAQEWLLVRQDDGSVGTLLRDHRDGTVRNAELLRFERGDVVRYRLDPEIAWRAPVAAGDTVLRIRSNEAERQAASLSGRVATAESAVSLFSSGAKLPVVERAERNLARARAQLDLAEKEVARLRPLAERSLVSRQELDAAESRLGVAEAEVAMAEAELADVTSGAKQEQLDLARQEVDAHRSELAAVEARLEQLTIQSPISGLAVRSFGTDTLLTVRDTSEAVVVVPVPWKDAHHLHVGDSVDVDMQEVPLRFAGRVMQFGDTVHRLGRQQVVMVTVMVDGLPTGAVPGAVVRCEIFGSPVGLAEYVRRKIR